MKKQLALLLLSCLVFSVSFCQTHQFGGIKPAPASAKHPAWIMQGNIYEVNVRQYTPEGTFNAFAKHLDRIKKMGVQTLWFMPINPISKVNRKGSLGSYYAVADYTSINPEFGTMNDWLQLVKKIHSLGMKVIIDWVPNHTGCDNHWLTNHPDFYVKDSLGKPAEAFDWIDTKQLNYTNMELCDSMIAAMKFWITKTDIDGFRCDVASNVPGAFWSKCIGVLRNTKEIFMLAEGDTSFLPKSGFDAIYSWPIFKGMKNVASGLWNVIQLDSIRIINETKYPANTLQMYFTSNHDENTWNKSDYETFPGKTHAPFAVFTQTMVSGVPLIYGGQEEPVLRAIRFFDKDTISFGKYERADFYKTLLALHKRNPALAPDASFKKIHVGDDNAVYAYLREKDGKKVFVILNLSAKEQKITINDKSVLGNTLNVFKNKNEILSSKTWKIAPWGYEVYEY